MENPKKLAMFNFNHKRISLTFQGWHQTRLSLLARQRNPSATAKNTSTLDSIIGQLDSTDLLLCCFVGVTAK
jgi:hypothetical protein